MEMLIFILIYYWWLDSSEFYRCVIINRTSLYRNDSHDIRALFGQKQTHSFWELNSGPVFLSHIEYH